MLKKGSTISIILGKVTHKSHKHEDRKNVSGWFNMDHLINYAHCWPPKMASPLKRVLMMKD